MCIVLFTTTHPDYALVLIDNRDEYILRPTSRPHWWTHGTSGRKVLSSRDLQRAEKGTWLGLTDDGFLAVLTNYREMIVDDTKHPVHGVKSRGGMVTAWLGGLPEESVTDGVHHLVKDGGVKGVGGFSMVCGKLRKKSQGIAIVSNRCGGVDDVPIVAKERGEIWGLSNAAFEASGTGEEWPKIRLGKELLTEVISESVSKKSSQEELITGLFSVLSKDTLPANDGNTSFIEYINQLKHSIFIPPIGDEVHRTAMNEAMAKGRAEWATDDQAAAEELAIEGRPDPSPSPMMGFETGLYGTQRQTVVLVDWEGNVTMVERALWDGNGNEVPRGEGDLKFEFKINGWDDETSEGLTAEATTIPTTMETIHAEQDVKGHIGTRRPTTAKLLSKPKRKRPTISGPIGPIKNSRGPDFIRSEQFVIVPGIKDCSSTESLFDKGVAEAQKTTRRISASFQKQGPPSSQPTTAKSDFNATTSCQTKLPRRLPMTLSMTSATKACLDTIQQDENVPPPDHGVLSPPKSTTLPKSQLPKSRTMSVLTDIKSSISRPSLVSRSANPRAFGSSSRKTSFSSRIRLPRPSLTSLSRSSRSTTPEPSQQLLPGQINTAQPSAYWSGRFMALHDRFLAENDDSRCRRVFHRLDSCCITDEARRSLHDWQQTYARRNGRPGLLPEGGCMQEKGMMNRIFGGGMRKSEARSLSALRGSL
ncbi:NRDE protein-domain-containing protein [Ilyonectria destructans]|nr:NRDE protein-domain-containing protein [Ilyonectria destructans]